MYVFHGALVPETYQPRLVREIEPSTKEEYEELGG